MEMQLWKIHINKRIQFINIVEICWFFADESETMMILFSDKIHNVV